MSAEVSANTRMVIIIVFALYAVGMVLIGLYSKKSMDKTAADKYVEKFSTGGRGMGALVVAMMTAAGLCSAGTFLGGPGLAYNVGLTWVMAGFAQILMNFTVLGAIGKKIGIVSRRINAQTYLDLLVSRYNKNKFIVVFGVLAIILFMGSYAVAQFVGGARLFESMTGLSYVLGLALFAGLVIAMAALGGISGVASATVLQGIVMTVSVIALFIGTLNNLGPLEPVYKEIISIDSSLTTPWTWSIPFQFSMWVVYGLLYVGQPHGVMGTLTYKDTRSMHRAIMIGVVLVFIWTLSLIWTGSLGRAIYPDIEVGDQIIPTIAMNILPAWVAGLTLAGVAGAIQSTVGSMIIIMTTTLVRNAYQSVINPNADGKKLKKVTIASTLIIGGSIFLLSIDPPDSLQHLITFGMGGLGACFLFPMLLGIYWKRTNEYGAVGGMIGGMITYILGKGNYIPTILGMDGVVIALIVSGLLTVLVSLATPKPPKGIVMTWFGKYYPKSITE